MNRRSFLDVTLIASFGSVMLLCGVAIAAPDDPVAVERPADELGASFVPGVRAVADLAQPYVEEEFFVSGASALYNYANDPPLGPSDLVVADAAVPYQTRIIVRRPARARRFNGTVVIEWWNSTAGFDTAPSWDASAEYFARKGIAYVGVTNSIDAVAFLQAGCSVLGTPPRCGTRYASLEFPENGLAFDVVSQIATLLRSDSPDNPLPPRFRVQRLFHVGQSQQGGSVITYASGFHFGANDGYFVQQAARARGLNRDSASLPSCADASAPAFPECTPALDPADALVRTDLPVPVVHAISETDIEVLFGSAFQPDAPNFRYYEVAGGGHLTVHEDVEVLPAGVLGPDPVLLENLCALPLNTTADGPVFVSHVFNALWTNLEHQVRWGIAPPAGRAMELAGPREVARDPETGNGLGGVQLPALRVPLATYTSGNAADPSLPPALQFIGNLACFLASSTTAFDEETLALRYPSHGAYVKQVARAAVRLWRDRLLTPFDAIQTILAAAHSEVGKAANGKTQATQARHRHRRRWKH